jgi:hypothetical protein
MPKKHTIETFIAKSILKHDTFYDYSKTIYINVMSKLEIICPLHGPFWQNAYDHLVGCGCPECGKLKRLGYQQSIKNDPNSLKNRSNQTCELHGDYKISQKRIKEDDISCPACDKEEEKNNFIDESIKKFGDNAFLYDEIEWQCYKKHIILICSVHGEIEIGPRHHLDTTCGCQLCNVEMANRNKLLGNVALMERIDEAHGTRYDYSNINWSQEFKARDRIQIICTKHGIFEQKIYNHANGAGCKQCAQLRKQSNYTIPLRLMK